VTRQCVGVSDPAMAERVLRVLVENGAERALAFCGDDGLDELTTTTTSHVFEYADGEYRECVLDPTAIGLARADHDAILGGDAAQNAAIVNAVLAGDAGAPHDIALLNAAAAITAAGIADDLPDALDAARESIESGRAADVLDRWRKVANDARAVEERAHEGAGA